MSHDESSWREFLVAAHLRQSPGEKLPAAVGQKFRARNSSVGSTRLLLLSVAVLSAIEGRRGLRGANAEARL